MVTLSEQKNKNRHVVYRRSSPPQSVCSELLFPSPSKLWLWNILSLSLPILYVLQSEPYWLKLIKQCVHSVAAYTVVVCKMAQAIVDIFFHGGLFRGCWNGWGKLKKKQSFFTTAVCVCGCGRESCSTWLCRIKNMTTGPHCCLLFTFVKQHTANPFVTSNLQTIF